MTASTEKRTKQAPHVLDPPESLLGLLLQVSVGVLLVVRLLVPTESAAGGDTLWVVQLWLGAALLWAWNQIREGDFRVRFDHFDVALWVVVAGHVVSAMSVLYFGGQKRAALNVMWEWVGLGVCFFLIRQTVHTHAKAHRLITLMLAVCLSLAALGLWQHYIFYPQMVREYDQKVAELEQLENGPPPRTSYDAIRRSQKIRELRDWFVEGDIPLWGPARDLWEQRLRSSTEPFGMFALANSFAGLLLVWLIIGIGILAGIWRKSTSWTERILPTTVVALIAFCLILTKSRTAWVGLLAGLTVWGCVQIRIAGFRLNGFRLNGFRLNGFRLKTWLWCGAAGSLLLGVMTAAAALSGGFDRKVIAEAPKSFRYRLEYWTGSWNALWERPVLGTGPGNFRQHYLRHKLPESSEEIADPHNLLLDLWANGGIIAVVGFFGCIAVAYHTPKAEPVAESRIAAKNPKATGGHPKATGGHPKATGGHPKATGGHPKVTGGHPELWDALTMGGCGGFAVVFLATLLAGNGIDLRLPILMAAAIGVIAFYGRISNQSRLPHVCLIAAAAGLLIHLLGAGGIEMPAIVQMLLVLTAIASTLWQKADSVMPQRSRGAVLGLGGLSLVLFVVCLLSATAPVLNRRALVSAGDQAQLVGNGTVSMSRYASAAEEDPFSPIPPKRLATLYYSRWALLPEVSTSDFDRAVELLTIAIELDPHNHASYRELGQWYRERYKRTSNRAAAAAAVDAFRRAVDRYPTQAVLRAELAFALSDDGNETAARKQAAAALRQDAVNHSRGHSDKYLPREMMIRLDTIEGRESRVESQKSSGP